MRARSPAAAAPPAGPREKGSELVVRLAELSTKTPGGQLREGACEGSQEEQSPVPGRGCGGRQRLAGQADEGFGANSKNQKSLL